MRKLLANIPLVVGVAALAVLVSVLVSYATCKWHWLGRSGAIVTMVGVILSVRPLARKGFAEWFRSSRVIDGGSLEPSAAEIEEERQETLDATASHIGVYMALIGTVVWAYGDLVGGIP